MEVLVTILIIAIATAFVAHRLFKTIKGVVAPKAAGPACGGCSGCLLADKARGASGCAVAPAVPRKE